MDPVRRYAVTIAAVVAIALGHALLTWPAGETVALFAGGAAVAFVLEVLAVRAGLLRHEMRPQVLGVPVVVVGAWPAVVYVAYRVALLGLPSGVPAAAGAAVLATASDLLAEPGATEGGSGPAPSTGSPRPGSPVPPGGTSPRGSPSSSSRRCCRRC